MVKNNIELTEPLKSLWEFINKFPAKGIHTYPKHDENNNRIYEGCCELEQMGLLFRKKMSEECIFFYPKDNIN